MRLKIMLVLSLLISSCTGYIADNKYVAHKVTSKHSVIVKFDLLLDENITLNDPRIKSIIYASTKKTQVVISYTNINAEPLANKIANLLTEKKLIVLKPQYMVTKHMTGMIDKYVNVYIKY